MSNTVIAKVATPATAALLVSPQALATGIMLPDMGLDTAIVAIASILAVAIVVCIVLRVTPSWRAILNSHAGLSVLATINSLLLLSVTVASTFLFSADSWLLLVAMFLGVPVVVIGMFIEILWGLMIRKSDHKDLPNRPTDHGD